MRYLLVIALAAGVVLAGCGKAQQSTVTKVQNPPEKPAPRPPSPYGVPGPGPTPGPAPSKAAAAVVGKWVKLPSGLEYKETKIGTGREAKASDSVTVQYKGWLDNGTVFDSSRKPGREPLTFTIGAGQVIKGWDEGVTGMKAGGVRELKIPPDLGYGDEEMGTIPANSRLHFEVELLKIN